jgi:hypothetical protein
MLGLVIAGSSARCAKAGRGCCLVRI